MNIDVFYCVSTADPSVQHLMFAPFVSLIANGDYVIGEEGGIYKVLEKCTVREEEPEFSMIVLLANEEPEKVMSHMRPDKVDWTVYKEEF